MTAASTRRERASTTSGSAPVIDLHGVRVSYGHDPALRGIDLQIAAGEQVAVMGPSGCGKSTLLHVLAGVLDADEGTRQVLGEELGALREKDRAQLRLARMGMIFQFGDLIGELTLAENLSLPLQLLGGRPARIRAEVEAMLERLGLGEVAGRRAAQVSGGQAQRAAVGRALIHQPALLLADEPTGALDTVAADTVMDALMETVTEQGTTLVVVTHDNRVAAHLDRLVSMRDGELVS
ncbi:macrolide ABC transporter ATP-binding protein [Brachybacterium vulturis]|uniref:Macrolide ABC transporter ATP-binding protein n=1 Tax=Brachybacterium vulturis TaxID=2017484 RepID=A0A291GPD7_9MICO|nr:ABC transporter ATP-binding protein [Brachybacterium vulturis]ATG52229.1 macrolide ABC transporter ATP-binding protein [Brachybacterium vulturis]